ncbi:1,4-alpha-glucan branching enzyme [Candidatus Saganbacteria bacterium CG08_land_8_20_14_0_20_45_16]|uniref:1,4-alpha-glucan branching enzyme GlgB n=1 Tax=Candidatus Saganbacteria bacterium CG08_land_8_20_14_0_20_45_16 TaxID=2014293 RepID=A0A2H0XZM8_UNCSA|nr:MAG: 1,4-alpha-glucan branching enzyme [Candidatus Saganbacteria bacterium CG08_land_8_20_14_0_20_45_16]
MLGLSLTSFASLHLKELLSQRPNLSELDLALLEPVSLQPESNVYYGPTLFTDFDIHLFKEGNHFTLYDKLGAHPMIVNGQQGTYFAVWAPNADQVSVVGNFNYWQADAHPLRARWDSSGIFEGFIPNLKAGELYKYKIISKHNNFSVEKGDPYAFFWEVAPKTASIIWQLDYEWQDSHWMQTRHKANDLNAAMSIYEVHLGSWRRVPEEGNRSLTYRELAPLLAQYVKEMGFTHVEFMPVMEHPFYGSWGYQVSGFFAPTSRYGTPQDFMYLIDYLHQQGIGVILDWVSAHFPTDQHGLAFFDGSHLYEHQDQQKGFHPDWKSCIFNYGRHEVSSFLINSALFWLEKFHIDGLRIDGVASMLYLDYSRKPGEWTPNEFGGNENLDAIRFLQTLNKVIYQRHPDVQTMAEESTAWGLVTRPTDVGGLGFGLKWNMGWMHDTLKYFSVDPLHRKYHHDQLTFSLCYAFSENFQLSLSHDEVVHGKGALFGKMPGDDWQKYANLRLLFGYMFGHPGKKLMFMGNEFGQWREWSHEESLEWHALDHQTHQGVKDWVRDLNQLYKAEPALYELDFSSDGFDWLDLSDWESSVISFIRKGRASQDKILVVCNFTPVPRHNYRLGVPAGGQWQELLNSDAKDYGGSGLGNHGSCQTDPIPSHGHPNSLNLLLPPLSVLFFKHTG